MTEQPPPTLPKAFIIGISGFTSSGKTTLARLLASILPQSVTVIHEDDYYKPEADLPLRAGHKDWDAPQSLDLPLLTTHLHHVRLHGHVPSATLPESTEPDAPHPSSTPAALLAQLREQLERSLPKDLPPIFILEGFLLFSPLTPSLSPLLDAKLFLLADYDEARERRKRREGYVTQGGGWWADPPGYVDEVVWPGFVEGYGWMFEDVVRNVVDEEAVERERLSVMPRELLEDTSEENGGIRAILEWAVSVLVHDLGGPRDQRSV